MIGRLQRGRRFDPSAVGRDEKKPTTRLLACAVGDAYRCENLTTIWRHEMSKKMVWPDLHGFARKVGDVGSCHASSVPHDDEGASAVRKPGGSDHGASRKIDGKDVARRRRQAHQSLLHSSQHPLLVR